MTYPEPTCRACQVSAPNPCWNHAEPEVEVEHDEECGDMIRYGGCCPHYCPTGEHKTDAELAAEE